jgi:hypothetical protein
VDVAKPVAGHVQVGGTADCAGGLPLRLRQSNPTPKARSGTTASVVTSITVVILVDATPGAAMFKSIGSSSMSDAIVISQKTLTVFQNVRRSPSST